MDGGDEREDVEDEPIEDEEKPIESVNPPVENGEPENNFEGKLAIIIDDLGHSPSLDRELLKIDKPVTVAVLPFLDHTREAVESFKSRDNFELILHIPMEPMDEIHREDFMLLTDHSKEEMEDLFSDALEQMNGQVVGVNNHKGSKFTSNSEKMREFLELVKERDLFFIDSYTLNTSVGHSLAQEMSIPTAKRDIFLDYVDEKEEIKENLFKAADLAMENGSAIAIGHHKENTLEVLNEELPSLEEMNVRLVKVSDLLE